MLFYENKLRSILNMKKYIMTPVAVLFVFSVSLFAAGPYNAQQMNRRKAGMKTYSVSITKYITLIPAELVYKNKNVIMKKVTRRRTAVFYRYSFSKEHFKNKFPGGISNPVKVKVHIFKKSVRTWRPQAVRDAQGRLVPMPAPNGGFRTVTFHCRIL
jgi:hypothetical protein